MTDKQCNRDNSCTSCGTAEQCTQAEKETHAQKLIDLRMSQIKHKFMVLSGKGGVGKSSVAVNMAATLSGQGHAVGLLDADIHGPNIPKMLGVESVKPLEADDGILPITTPDKIRVMSIAFFLREHDNAVIWRGPLKHSLLRQFLGDVVWGPLDYLIIDLPPGTGDEALSIVHLLKRVSGALIITTPQDVALLDARKSITFCREIQIPIIGVVENMSGMTCPHCQSRIELFKTGGGERIAQQMKVPFIGRIPLDPAMVVCTDEGRPFVLSHPDSEARKAFVSLVDNWNRLIAVQ
jgi:Mrp family chromosome partitioning ATPase